MIPFLHYLIMTSEIVRLQTSSYGEVNFYDRPPLWTMEEHSHEYYQILIVLEGELTVTMDTHEKNGRFICRRGDMLYIPPGAVHSLASETGYSQVGINTRTAGQTDDREILGFLESLSKPLSIPLPHDLLKKQDHGAELLRQKPPLFKPELLIIMDEVLLFLIKTSPGTPAPLMGSQFSKIQGLLNGYLKKKLTLTWAAEELNISVPHLERLCHRYYGHGLIEEHLERKADLACRELSETAKGVEEIGRELGFTTGAYFSRFFSKKTAMSPSTYRSKFRGG